MSYTTFHLSNIDIDENKLEENGVIQATVTIQNTGKFKGQEVIQLYVGFENSQFMRPVKLLRAFEKVELQPGESRKVSMKVPLKDLSYYDIESHSWEIEKMKYSIYIGNQSQSKDFLTAQIEVK